MKMRVFSILLLALMFTGIVTVGAQDAVECEAGFRAVTDANGTDVCLPEAPERVIALMESDLDALLALGVDVVGTTNGRGQSTPPRYLSEYLPEALPVVGNLYQPNLEAVLALDPDLILMGGFNDEDVLAQLNAIAPVFNTLNAGEDWKTQFERVGDALNMQDEVEAFIEAYDERAAEMGEALEAEEPLQFIVARWSADGPQLMAPINFSSRILTDLGMVPPVEIPELAGEHQHTAPLSLENVGLLDVDWAFIGTLQSEGEAVEALEEAIDTPLFQALDVVKDERVVFMDGSLWTSVGGPLAALAVLDDVEAALLAVEAE